MKRKLFYKRVYRILSMLLLFNLFVFVVYLLYLFDVDIKRVINASKSELKVENVAWINGHSKIDKHLMYAGHSISGNQVEEMLDFEAHHYHFVAEKDTISRKKKTVKKPIAYYGVDVSHWQNKIDWSKLTKDTVPHHLDFYIVKATQGDYYVDEFYSYNHENASKHSKLVGSYHFYIFKDDPVKQAENYIKHAKIKTGNLRPIIDIELDCTGCDKPDVNKKQMVKNLRTFISKLENHFKVKPILYSNMDFYHTYLRGEFDQYPFWIAQYTSYPPKGMNMYKNINTNQSPFFAIWQFSNAERFNGIIGGVDLNFMPAQNLQHLVVE